MTNPSFGRREGLASPPFDRRDYGRLEQKVEHLTATVEALAASVAELRDTISEAKGGWRVVMMGAGLAGVFGSALAWVAQHIRVS